MCVFELVQSIQSILSIIIFIVLTDKFPGQYNPCILIDKMVYSRTTEQNAKLWINTWLIRLSHVSMCTGDQSLTNAVIIEMERKLPSIFKSYFGMQPFGSMDKKSADLDYRLSILNVLLNVGKQLHVHILWWVACVLRVVVTGILASTISFYFKSWRYAENRFPLHYPPPLPLEPGSALQLTFNLIV